MSGKGKGKHAAMKNKYLHNPIRGVNNKKLKASRHSNKMAKIALAGEETMKLLEQAITITGLKKASLKKTIGTLNARRLKAVVSGSYFSDKWYLDRSERRKGKRHVRTLNKPKSGDGVPEGGSPSDGNTQVDSE